MAGLENLTALIYHERQEPGSMLCAQHALNSLLQGAFFTAPDLSEIALQLDELEDNYGEVQQSRSTSNNMDDTGFFSVQVLENALKVWGLNLVRWRGEEMRPYQDHPHTQLAFILNHEQHWYTLRRFGPVLSNFQDDPGHGHWYNLNSFLSKPEWVGRLYLGMFLQQAETDGYSIFVVIQTDPSAPLALPRTEADHLAAAFPEPGSASHQSAIGTSNSVPQANIEGLEDEDWELQAALQASLENTDDLSVEPPRSLSSGIDSAASSSQPDIPDTGEADFGAASRRLLQQMQAEQEYAQRELWNTVPRPRRDDDDDEILRRVLAESEAMANADSGERTADEEDMDVGPSIDTPTSRSSFSEGRTSLLSGNLDRNYDDEDAELQAALRASLEDTPVSWSTPTFQATAPVPESSLPTATSSKVPPSSQNSIVSEDADDTDIESSDAGEAAQAVNMEEMRKRRLARFGG